MQKLEIKFGKPKVTNQQKTVHDEENCVVRIQKI